MSIQDHVVSKPTIGQRSDWKIEQGCGYEHCGPPPVDFLVGKDLSIRIEPHNDKTKNRFAILLAFIPKGKFEVQFNPSLVEVDLPNNRLLAANGYHCSGKIWDPLYRRSVAPLAAPIVITLPRSNCFLLFFDSPPPDVSESFKMRLAGVVLNGKSLSVPEVIFQKGISKW